MRVLSPARRAAVGPACVRNDHEATERRVEEPSEPHALASPPVADAVHPVVPITGADQRQAMLADVQAPVERTSAMLEERAVLVRRPGLEIRLELIGSQ
jgi:hypothetical protein